MKKKIFTLLSSALMLFGAVFVSYGQPWLGNPVTKLDDTKSAYHLRVVALGNNILTTGDATNLTPKTGLFLAIDNLGRLVFRDGDYIVNPKDPLDHSLSALSRLNETLWCVDNKVFSGSHGAQFTFLNKYYGSDLSVSLNVGERVYPYKPNSSTKGDASWKSASEKDSITVFKYFPEGDTAVLLGGDQNKWLAGSTYIDQVAGEFALRIPHPNQNDYQGWYLTLAVYDKNTGGDYNKRGLVLALAHSKDFEKGSDFFDNHLVRFALYETVPRLLTGKGINELLSEGLINLADDYTLAANESNPLKDVTSVEPNDESLFVKLVVGSNYLYVKDGENVENYYSGYGKKYPKIGTVAKTAVNKDVPAGRANFRFVYYPSKGSVVISVEALRIAEFDREGNVINKGNSGKLFTDTVTKYLQNNDPGNWISSGSDAKFPYLPGITWNNYYSYQHSDLFVQAQRLEASAFVVTAGGSTSDITTLSNQFFIGKGQAGCEVVDTRTTIEDNLYLIKNTDNRYLTVPLYTGNYSPQWVSAEEVDAFNSPAFHWFVTQYENSPKAKVEIRNREFDNIYFEYVQIHEKDGKGVSKTFLESWVKGESSYQSGAYGSNIKTARINNEGFTPITDPKYRRDEWLGYRNVEADAPSLGSGSYTLEYYNRAISSTFSIGLKPLPDTLLWAVPSADQTLFTLAPGADHYYGISDATYKSKKFNGVGQDTIAPLRRKSYTFRVSDYTTSSRNGRLFALPKNSDTYVHGKDADVRIGTKLPEFFLRYQYTPVGADKSYYSLLQRIDQTDFKNIAADLKLTLAEYLWSDNITSTSADTFGVLQVAVDPYTLGIKAVPRFNTANAVSAFTLQTMKDHLYRRLDDAGLGSKAELGDAPRTLKFYHADGSAAGSRNYLYEDMWSRNSYDLGGTGTSADGTGIRFLGLSTAEDNVGTNEIYVDTAFVNRAGYDLKPQYLLAIHTLKDQLAFPQECPVCQDKPLDEIRYTYGRYLINAFDTLNTYGEASAKAAPYTYGRYNRLVFVEAIHAGDVLWILRGGQTPLSDSALWNRGWMSKLTLDYTAAGGQTYREDEPYLNFSKVTAGATPVSLNNAGRHTPYVFSFRFADPTGTPNRPFLIESETTKNPGSDAPAYAPAKGGWIKLLNGRLVISRQDLTLSEDITDAALWDIETESVTSNEEIPSVESSDLQVISGSRGSLTILNASGKRVVLSNILGQTILKSVITSDRAVLNAPAGVVIVSVEGAGTVKAIVK